MCSRYVRGLAAKVSLLLSHRKGDVGKVVKAIGGSAHAPHLDGDMICAGSSRSH